VSAFDRYLEAKPAPKADEALYYKALAQREMELPADALDTLEVLMLGYPRSQRLASAWFEKAATLASTGDTEQAVKAYQDVAAFFPSDKLAPQAVWNAARLHEADGRFVEAARLYEELQASFPAYESADAALWRSGLAYYRSGAPDKAETAWEALLAKYAKSSYRAKSLYWLGKLKNEAKAGSSGGTWDQVLELDPHGYYALRVAQMRAGTSLGVDRMVPVAAESPEWDAAQSEEEVLAWLRGWTQVPTGTRLIELPAAIASRPDLKRGQALLAVGMRREALAALDGARAATWNNALGLAQLGFFFRSQELYGLAARCAARLAGLWPGGVIQDAPQALQRLSYPLAYADLVSAEAVQADLDPLLLAALIRQESLFEPAAESYAGARGLGQVMPATGEGIAKSLGMEGFVLDDLYRPWVSIRFAAFYLAAQLKRFDGQLLVALAGYNGGPGNTLHWLEGTEGDVDLFVEMIGATQSRNYLQRVYEQYITYEQLYR
jgi:soluble lytic murein transglycosylase